MIGFNDEFVAAHLPMAERALSGCKDGHWQLAAGGSGARGARRR